MTTTGSNTLYIASDPTANSSHQNEHMYRSIYVKKKRTAKHC